MKKKIDQSKNDVRNGDIIGGNKFVSNLSNKIIAVAREGVREELGFDPHSDKKNTTLLKKLKEGKFSPIVKKNAVRSKLKTLNILLKISKTEEGKKVIADIYENLIVLITSKYLMDMEDGDLLKTKMKDIYDDLTLLVKKYNDLFSIDEAFLDGLIYIATSNCAIRWKMVDEL